MGIGRENHVGTHGAERVRADDRNSARTALAERHGLVAVREAWSVPRRERPSRNNEAGRRVRIILLQSFADTLKAKFSLPGSASPEDQLKPVVADLLKSAGTDFGLTVDSRTETHLSEHKVRPDIAIYVGGLICGYIELKAPGLGADAPKLKGEHNKKQWEKLKGLPNLIYTDGREWALYRGGERPGGHPVRPGGQAVPLADWRPCAPPKCSAQYLLRHL